MVLGDSLADGLADSWWCHFIAWALKAQRMALLTSWCLLIGTVLPPSLMVFSFEFDRQTNFHGGNVDGNDGNWGGCWVFHHSYLLGMLIWWIDIWKIKKIWSSVLVRSKFARPIPNWKCVDLRIKRWLLLISSWKNLSRLIDISGIGNIEGIV